MRILFIGDIVGRAGRTVVHRAAARARFRLEARSRRRQRRERGRRLRHHRGDLSTSSSMPAPTRSRSAIMPGTSARRWSSSSARRACIRPLNYPPGTPGRGAAMVDAKNGARVLVINAMGRVFMDPLDDPFAAVERELAACRAEARRRRDRHRHALRGDQREAGDGPFLSTAAPASWSAPTPMRRPPTTASCRRHRLHLRCRHDRRLRFGDRHGQGRAAQPLPAQDPVGQVRARERRRRRSAASRSRPTTPPAWRPRRRRCGSAVVWKRRGPLLGLTLLYFAPDLYPPINTAPNFRSKTVT